MLLTYVSTARVWSLDARLVTPYLASGVTVTIVTSAIYTYVSATGVLESKGRALV